MTTSWRRKEDLEAARWADARRHGLSAADQEALAAWLSQRPGRSRLLDRHDALLSDAALEWVARRASQARDAEPASWGRATGFPGSARVLTAGVVAAGVAGFAALFLTPLLQGDRLVGAPGAARPLALADGSSIRLNGNSEARVDLAGSERLIRLEGEGFFEVAPDKARPFSVLSDGVRITAVGTRFNVDQHDHSVEVVVYEGAVDVTPRKGQPIRVKAGDRAIVSADRVMLAPPARAVEKTALPTWTEGWLEADAAPLIEIVHELERSSGARIELDGGDLQNLTVSGRFRLDKPEQVLRAVAAMHDLSLTRRGVDGFRLSTPASPPSRQ